MKTILVLSSFSGKVGPAVYYAKLIAEKTNSELLLVHTINSPVPPKSFSMEYPEEGSSKTDDLTPQLIRKWAEGKEILSIETNLVYTGEARLNSLETILATRDILMIVETHHAGDDLRSWFVNRREDGPYFPMLLVPEIDGFNDISKILFLMDPGDFDLDPLHFLVQLAYFFDAEITIADLCDRGPNRGEKRRRFNHFRFISEQLNYFNITFKELPSNDIPETLKRYAESSKSNIISFTSGNKRLVSHMYDGHPKGSLVRETGLPTLFFL